MINLNEKLLLKKQKGNKKKKNTSVKMANQPDRLIFTLHLSLLLCLCAQHLKVANIRNITIISETKSADGIDDCNHELKTMITVMGSYSLRIKRGPLGLNLYHK